MLTEEERNETLDYVIGQTIERGKLAYDYGLMKIYEIGFPLCSLKVNRRDKIEQNEPITVVNIAEAFLDPRFRPGDRLDTTFDGLRVLYVGGYGGLDEVYLEGITFPDQNGKASSRAERFLRGKDMTDGRHLQTQDLERYDILLKYAEVELGALGKRQ